MVWSCVVLLFFLLSNASAFSQDTGTIQCDRDMKQAPAWTAPGSSYVIEQLSCGQSVSITGFEKGYFRIQIGNRVAYVYAKYVRTDENKSDQDRRIAELEAQVKALSPSPSLTASTSPPAPIPQATIVQEKPRGNSSEISSEPVRSPSQRLLSAKSVYLVNQSMDHKVFENLEKKLKDWGRWKIVYAESEADIVLVFSEQNVYLGSMQTASATSTVVGTTAYGTGTGFSVPLMSMPRYLIAVDIKTKNQLAMVSCERRIGSGSTAGVLVNKLSKHIEKIGRQEAVDKAR